MRITELVEAINQTSVLTDTAYTLLRKEIDKFVKENRNRIYHAIGVENIIARMESNDKKIADIREQQLPWQEEEKLVEPLQNQTMDLWGDVERDSYTSEPNKEIVEDFKHTLELDLQNVARDYIETQFGKIMTKDPSQKDINWDTRTKQNLYWLEHIIVQLDTKGANARTGEPKTGGGYYQAYPSKNKIQSRYGQTIDWWNDLAVHVNVYTSEKKLWEVLTNRLQQLETEDRYGESSISNPIPKFLKDILHTYVHEVVHLEQDARLRINKQQAELRGEPYGVIRTDHTMLPNPDQPRPKITSFDPNSTKGSDVKNADAKYRKYRGGKRGNPVQGVDRFENNLNRWSAYLGSVNEIEAHAANAASELYMEMLSNLSTWRSYSYSDIDRQREINQFVDNEIDNIRYGYFPKNFYTMASIEQTAKEAMQKPNPTNREKRFIKVWQTYVKKIIKHLQSYKKPVPKEEY